MSESRAKVLLRDLTDVDRRIDNMRFLLGFQVEKRDRIAAQLREALGRETAELRFVDFDARRDPATDRWCLVCQKDLGPSVCELRHVDVRGAPHAVAIADAALLDLGVLRLPDGAEDRGWHPVGRDCAKSMGKGWTRDERPTGGKGD